MGYGAIGTDTGGSIRVPASFCGVVGMKPTFGSVSKWGVYPLAQTLDHVGPMTRTVKDNAIMLNSLVGYDAKDYHSIQRKPEDFTSKLGKGMQGVVIGIPSNAFYNQLDKEIQVKIDKVIAVYEQLGAIIRTIEVEGLESLSWAHRTILKTEAFSLHKNHLENDDGSWESEVKERMQSGEQVKGYEYIEALEIKRKGIQSYNQLFKEVDVLLTPVTPIMPFNLYEREIEMNDEKIHVFSILNKLTGITNLTGFPSMSVPCGLSEAGLPVGFELTGRALDESLLYSIAYAYEQNGQHH